MEICAQLPNLNCRILLGKTVFNQKVGAGAYTPPTFSSCVGLKELSSATQSYYSISLLPNGETHNKNML